MTAPAATGQNADSPGARIELSRDVDGLVAERWPFFVGRLRTQGGIPMSALATAEGVESHLGAFARQYPAQDARGVASLWGQWYAVTVWPPLVTAILLCEAAPELRAAHTALVLDDEAKPAGLALPAFATTGDPGHSLERLARLHTAPLMDAVAGAAGMAQRVLWSNVANVFGWFLDELEAVAAPHVLEPGRRLLTRGCWPDGTRNPLHIPGARPEPPRPERRVCCLRYRLDGFGYCGDCPITRHQCGGVDQAEATTPS
ncbi:MAG: siderophore-iron reductase FhuF [Halofilum sp. (in: g-proteobacteria)]